MEEIRAKVEEVKQAIANEQVANAAELEQFRIKYLGSKGQVKGLFAYMKDVPGPEKREFGQLLNSVKQDAEAKFEALKQSFSANGKANKIELDLTAPAQPIEIGARHPLSIVRNEIISIFEKIGFVVADGPEVEDDWHNFTALNIPFDHPARDMQDTFFVQKDPDWVLRTHTSNVQIRAMETQKPPIRILAPGRVYRNETISARAHCLFHQVEGLYIAENVSFAELKETLLYFAKSLYGENTTIRLRPSYFPFTEPSAEMDVSCMICGGEGCKICKYTGWVEILGCGMVDPNVLENCGIDAQVYSGYAFGMGIERITMLKYQIDDIRLFFENDKRFLEQFK
ncbi:MAG: phenylalanine--tRNA ligase subunit alpha [Saprospiraceae bacterium]|nr:phenylalanine--tRNA ligase subunit alpha [Saprospiraceae bacterium]